MKLETERLVLRQPVMKDAEDIAEGIKDIKVSRYLAVVPHPYKLKDGKWFVDHCKKKWSEKPQKSYEFAIELKSDKKVIGIISLHKIDFQDKRGGFGYWLANPYWRKGIMSEAFKEVIRFAFENLKLRRLDVEAFIENKASQALIRKMGFKKEGRRRQHTTSKATGRTHDDYTYGLLKEEWKK